MGKLRVLNLVIAVLAVLLFIGIVIIATDFYLLWLPLAHSADYPIKVTALFTACTALVTLLVVFAAVQTIKQRDDQERRDRKQRWLKEITDWATNIKGCPFEINVFTHFHQTTLENLIVKILGAHARTSHIETITDKVFGDTLHEDVIDVIDASARIINILGSLCGFKEEFLLPIPKKLKKQLIKEVEEATKKGIDEEQALVKEYSNLIGVATDKLLRTCASIENELLTP